MIQNHNIKNIIGLNDHNSRSYSGMEYVFIAPLDEFQKASLIKRYKKDLYNPKTVTDFDISIGHIDSSGRVKNEEEEPEDENLNILEHAGWLLIPINRNKSKFNIKTQGEFRGKSYSNQLSIFVVGSSRITVEFFHRFINNDFAVIFKDANENYRLLFDPIYNNQIEVEQDSGEGLTAENGFNVSISNSSKLPAPFVYGEFEAAGAISDGVPMRLSLVNTAKNPVQKKGELAGGGAAFSNTGLEEGI